MEGREMERVKDSIIFIKYYKYSFHQSFCFFVLYLRLFVLIAHKYKCNNDKRSLTNQMARKRVIVNVHDA